MEKQTGSVRKESFPEHVRVSMFVRGLKTDLNRLSGWQLKTLPEVYQKALSYDADYNLGQPKFTLSSPGRSN